MAELLRRSDDDVIARAIRRLGDAEIERPHRFARPFHPYSVCIETEEAPVLRHNGKLQNRRWHVREAARDDEPRQLELQRKGAEHGVGGKDLGGGGLGTDC